MKVKRHLRPKYFISQRKLIFKFVFLVIFPLLLFILLTACKNKLPSEITVDDGVSPITPVISCIPYNAAGKMDTIPAEYGYADDRVGSTGNFYDKSESQNEDTGKTGTDLAKSGLTDNNTASGAASESQALAVFSPEDTDSSQNINNDQNANNNDLLFNDAIIWGPVNIFMGKGFPRELTIKNNTGIGWVSVVNGDDYLYALDISSGNLIGDDTLSYPHPGIDIGEKYAFIYDKDGIKVYDTNNNFSFVKAISNQSHNLHISNFGSYLYVEDSKSQNHPPDYLIDKKTLAEVNLYDINKLIMGQSVGQDLDSNGINHLLYPDCMICPSSKLQNNSTTDAVYSIKEGKIIGYLPTNLNSKQTDWIGWDPQKKFFFSEWADNSIMVYDMVNQRLVSTVPGRSLSIVNAAQNYTGYGGRVEVINNSSLSRTGFYFLNVYDSSSVPWGYVLDSSGIIKCSLANSIIIGEFKFQTYFMKDDFFGANRYDCSNIWTKEFPMEGSPHGPYFTEDSIAWLTVSSGYKGHGDAIYQWDYSTGSFLNYTEFAGYDVEIISSNPLILAMKLFADGYGGTWNLVCYDPGKLPLNLVPDIKIEYGPKEIYPEKTQVKFTCTVTNLPAQISSQNISYIWDFGDGMGGSGREVTHIYKNGGSYNVSVSVQVGDSPDSFTESVKVEVAKSPSIDLTAAAQRYTAEGLSYNIDYKISDLPHGWTVMLDFGDGASEIMEFSRGSKSHVYIFGNYIIGVTIYNADKTLSYNKEIPVISKFPDFSINASTEEGFSVLKVDFAGNLLSAGLTDSGLKYEWSIGTKIISEKKAFEYVFVETGTYTVILRVKTPTGITIDDSTIDIKVNTPVLTLLNGGRKIQSSASMFTELQYDKDKDGISQEWEDAAMNAVNPLFELDEGESMLKSKYRSTDKAVNFVMVSPYPSVTNKKYILFTYGITWTRDYGRYSEYLLGHNGDIEKVVMAWEIIDDRNLELKWVYTSAHSNELPDHSGVWNAKGKTLNIGKAVLWPDDYMCEALEFNNNIMKFYVSEDKHAIYPTESCGESVVLVFIPAIPPLLIPPWLVREDVGSDGKYKRSFTCYNIGERNAPLNDDIGFIFPNERVWSGNINNPEKFAGGLKAEDGIGYIGGNLSGDPPKMLKKVLDGIVIPSVCPIVYGESFG